VRVADAALLEAARVAARHRERPVPERHAHGLAAGAHGILDCDLPRLGARRRAEPIDAAAAEVHERRVDAAGTQPLDRPVDGIALADPAEVELDAVVVEAHGSGGAIEKDVPIAHGFAHARELRGLRHAPFVAEEAPRLHQRAHGHVEGPVRLTAPAQAHVDELEELRLHGHRSARGLAVEARERAVAPVVAEQPVEAVNLVESGGDRGWQGGCVPAAGADGRGRAHRDAGLLVAGDAGRLPTPAGRRERQNDETDPHDRAQRHRPER